MLAPSIFKKWFGAQHKEGKYIRHYMLNFLPYVAITPIYYYSPINNKYLTLYVRSYCLSKTRQFTDMNE